MSQNPVETPETWSVALAADNIATMTLDDLDTAFQQGRVSERTLVWQEGMPEWVALGELLGGEEEEAPAEPAPVAQAPVAAAPVAAAPVAAAPAVQAPAQAAFGAASPSLVPAPAVASAPSVVPAAPSAPLSTAPMALNMPMDDDLSSLEFPKKKNKLGLIAAAAVLLGGIGLTAMNLSGGGEKTTAAAAAALPVAGKPLASNDPNAPLQVGGYQISKKEEAAIKKETEAAAAMRAKMNDALSGAKTEKEKAKAAKGAMRKKYGASRKSAPKKKAAVSSGGNKYDPLNGSLP